jgi:hypothetical protein
MYDLADAMCKASQAAHQAQASIEAWLEIRDVPGVDPKKVQQALNNQINAISHASNLAWNLGYTRWVDLL